jgi:glycosyltransferase involved in cell wall biosynthesis
VSGKKPRVSIGLPVFNGEKYVGQAIDSILAQTFQDFELIISDNASTDSTQKICKAYAKKDRRIRYCRNKRNLGVVYNFNRVFELAEGEYFKWAAYDDIVALDYLRKCVSLLDQDPTVVICHTDSDIIDENGSIIGTFNHEMRLSSEEPHERFGDLIFMSPPSTHQVISIFGVMRANTIRETNLMGAYVGSDRNFLAEIALIGRIYEIPECLFYRRNHPEAYSSNFRVLSGTPDGLLALWGTSKPVKLITWYNFLEYIRSVKRVPLNRFERFLCYVKILNWLVKEGWVLMLNDLKLLSHSKLLQNAMLRTLGKGWNKRWENP